MATRAERFTESIGRLKVASAPADENDPQVGDEIVGEPASSVDGAVTPDSVLRNVG